MCPPGWATALTSLMVNCVAVDRTFDPPERVADRYAAVPGDEPSITHTTRPPRRALPSLSGYRLRRRRSRSRMLPGIFQGQQRPCVESQRRLVARIDAECDLCSSK